MSANTNTENELVPSTPLPVRSDASAADTPVPRPSDVVPSAGEGPRRALLRSLLSDPKLYDQLERRAASLGVQPAERRDLVHATMLEALSEEATLRSPLEPEAIKKRMMRMLKHNGIDLFRQRRRENAPVLDEEAAPEDTSLEARETLAWAATELPPGKANKRTFERMLAEARGEDLEDLARKDGITLKVAVWYRSTLRAHFRRRRNELMTIGILVLFALVLFLAVKRPKTDVATPPDKIEKKDAPKAPPAPEPTPKERSEQMIKHATELCHQEQWSDCIKELHAAENLYEPSESDMPRLRALEQEAVNEITRDMKYDPRDPDARRTTRKKKNP